MNRIKQMRLKHVRKHKKRYFYFTATLQDNATNNTFTHADTLTTRACGLPDVYFIINYLDKKFKDHKIQINECIETIKEKVKPCISE